MERVAIVGIGLHPFGRTPGVSGLEQGVAAAREALADAGLRWADIGVAYGGSRSSGHAAAASDRLGLTGLPFVNVYTGCATGGSALFSASNAIRAGVAKYAMAIGFDKHERGAFAPNPESNAVPPWLAESGLMVTAQFFALKLQRYMHEYGISEHCLVDVAQKAYENGARTPTAWRREAVSHAQIASSEMICDPLRKYMFCSPGEGGVAIILTSEREARRLGVQAVVLEACVLRTRRYGTFEVYDSCVPATITPPVTEDAAHAAFEAAGIGPEHIDLVQVQDTESGAEIMHLAECGFCAHGEQERLIRDGETRIDGRLPVNTDGGCLANGEPIGASGLRQVHEICMQLRGRAEGRQVGGEPKTGFTQVYGAPGLSAVTVLSV